MNDLLADQLPYWQRIECGARTLRGLRLSRMRVPIVENAEAFPALRSAERTDIVEKEMYLRGPRRRYRLSLRLKRPQDSCRRLAINMGCCTAGNSATRGPRARCSGANGRRRGATGSSTRSSCEAFGYTGRTSTSRSSVVGAPRRSSCGITDVDFPLYDSTPNNRHI